MAREDVNIKVSANVAEAIRLWKAMEAGPQGMANEMDALAMKGRKAATTMSGEFQKIIGHWVSIQQGIAAAKKILDAFMQSQREHAIRTQGATVGADQLSRELFQLTPGNIPLERITGDMLRLSEARRVQPVQAKEAIAALLGAGYSYEQAVTGGGADVVLRTLAATNATGAGVDTKGLVDAMTGHLEATGQAKSRENLQAAGMMVQGLFAGTKLEITDLQALAPRAANIFKATGLANEQLAIMSQFKDITSPEVGATGFQTAIMRLVQAGNVRTIRGALGQLKDEQGRALTPEMVDFQGENFFQVQQLLAGAFERAGEAAPRIKGRMFGNEGLIGANVLFTPQGIAQTQERLRMGATPEAFNRAAAVAEGGFMAKRAEAEAREMATHALQDFVDPEAARKQMMAEIKERGGGAMARFLGGVAFDASMYFNPEDAETAVNFGTRWAGGNREMAGGIVEKAKAEPVAVTITLSDQNGVAIPHKAEVHNVGKNKAGRER